LLIEKGCGMLPSGHTIRRQNRNCDNGAVTNRRWPRTTLSSCDIAGRREKAAFS
jgi:hypothetical protein